MEFRVHMEFGVHVAFRVHLEFRVHLRGVDCHHCLSGDGNKTGTNTTGAITIGPMRTLSRRPKTDLVNIVFITNVEWSCFRKTPVGSIHMWFWVLHSSFSSSPKTSPPFPLFLAIGENRDLFFYYLLGPMRGPPPIPANQRRIWVDITVLFFGNQIHLLSRDKLPQRKRKKVFKKPRKKKPHALKRTSWMLKITISKPNPSIHSF